MAACNAIFLLLVVSLLYKGSICDEQQLEALEKKLQVLEQKLLDMENKQHTESRKLHRTIETMNQVTNQQHQYERRLERESMKLHQTIAAVDEVKAENQNSLEQLGVTKALFLQAMKKVDEVSEKVDKVDSKVGNLSTVVAFTATMTQTFIPELKMGWGLFGHYPLEESPLPFNSVQVNIGNGYNRSTYKFTCPVSGMYYFSFSLHSGRLQSGTDAYYSEAYIYHGSHRVAGGYSFTYDKDTYMEAHDSGSWMEAFERDYRYGHTYMQAQTAASAVIRCDATDEVEVRPGDASGTDGNRFFGDSTWPRSTFTGFLISLL